MASSSTMASTATNRPDPRPTTSHPPDCNALLKQAVDKARAVYSLLPNGDVIFQQCITQDDSISDVLKSATRNHRSYKEKRSTKILDAFQKHTLFLQNMSDVIDVVVQTEAGIGCPLWAPIKFILKISKNHAQAADDILTLIQTISENTPRFNLYQSLPRSDILDAALINIFADIVEFTVEATRFYQRGSIARNAILLIRPFDERFGGIFARIKRHTDIVDRTAIAMELSRAAQYRADCRKLEAQLWLKPQNVKDFHHVKTKTRMADTCGWIQENSMFQHWSDLSATLVSDRLLCIAGTHGCGKTVLASLIIEHMEKQQFQVLYFYFSGNNTTLQGLDVLLRALMWQAMETSTNQDRLDIIHELMLRGPPTTEDLLQTLTKMLLIGTQPICCVIDGIDEYRDTPEPMFQAFFGIIHNSGNVRMLLLGRQYALQPSILESIFASPVQILEITTQTVDGDISKFIESEMSKRIDTDMLDTVQMRKEVFDTLHRKSEGMFLWVDLAIKGLAMSSTKSEFKERLRTIPSSLEGVYFQLFSRLLQRLDKYQLQLARKILEITIASARLLKVAELQHALAISSGDPSDFQNRLLQKARRTILEVCGDFIKIQDDEVGLVHYSLKEYLTRPQLEWHSAKDQEIISFRADLAKSHESMASLCCGYLTVCSFPEKMNDQDDFPDLEGSHPLLSYASSQFLYHLTKAGNVSVVTQTRMKNLCMSSQLISWTEYMMLVGISDGFTLLDDWISNLETFFEHIDSATGFHQSDDGVSLFDVLQHSHREISRRLSTFGMADTRFEIWRKMLFSIRIYSVELGQDLSHSEMLHDPDRSVAHHTVINSAHILQALDNQGISSLHRNGKLFFTLLNQLQNVTILTDPLKLLLQAILRKAHTVPVRILMMIALFYRRMGKNEEALEVLHAALNKLRDKNVVVRFEIQHIIGEILDDQMKFQKAVEAFTFAVHGYNIILGPEHQDTLRSTDWLARALSQSGKDDEAEIVLRALVETHKQVSGESHPDTLAQMLSHAITIINLRREAEAEVILRRCITFHQQEDGCTAGFQMLNCVYHLAFLLLGQHKASDYAELLQPFLHAKYFENTNRRVTSLTANLGRLLLDEKMFGDAESIFRRAYDARKEVLGESNKSTLFAMTFLVESLRGQNKDDEAEVLITQKLQIVENTFGEKSLEMFKTKFSLAELRFDQEQYSDAECLLKDVVQGATSLLGPSDLWTLKFIDFLGLCFYRQKRFQKARETYEAVIKVMPEEFADIDCQHLSIMINLGETYCALGIVVKADEIMQTLLLCRPPSESTQQLILKIDSLAREIERLKVHSCKNEIIDTSEVESSEVVSTSVEEEMSDTIDDLDIYDE